MSMPAKKLKSTAFSTVDLDQPGKQVGFVMIPHSPNDDAWGVTRIPLTVVANGTGPTVIIEGGNHGDEYEGPIVISELIRELRPGEIQGRLILMPANNVHAVVAGQRISPIDGLNFNRTFPGDTAGSITQQISAYMVQEIFPRGNVFIDLHSGGSSLDILASAVIEPSEDSVLLSKNIELAKAFDAPASIVIPNLGDPRTATACACSFGLTTIGTELGGGGTVSREGVETCRRGVRNVLAHLGVIAPLQPGKSRSDQHILQMSTSRAYVYATMDGVFESFHALGSRVHAGEPAGRIHCTWDPAREPEILHFGADGILYARRQPGRVRPGNCCAVVGSLYAGTALS